MLVADFDFELPKHLIAQAPPEVRGQSRLLVVDRALEPGQVTHQMMSDLPAWLRPGDLLVVNDTKVLPGAAARPPHAERRRGRVHAARTRHGRGMASRSGTR